MARIEITLAMLNDDKAALKFEMAILEMRLSKLNEKISKMEAETAAQSSGTSKPLTIALSQPNIPLEIHPHSKFATFDQLTGTVEQWEKAQKDAETKAKEFLRTSEIVAATPKKSKRGIETPSLTSTKLIPRIVVSPPRDEIAPPKRAPSGAALSEKQKCQPVSRVISGDFGYAVYDLEQLPTTESMHLGPIAYYERPFIREVGYNDGESFIPLSIAETAAMALTEIACSGGVGKFFYCNKTYGRSRSPPFNHMPDIIYVPKAWSRGEKAACFDESHYMRFKDLNAATAPDLNSKDTTIITTAMPIQIVFSREELKIISIPMSDVSPNSLLLIGPCCYAITKDGLKTLPGATFSQSSTYSGLDWVDVPEESLRDDRYPKNQYFDLDFVYHRLRDMADNRTLWSLPGEDDELAKKMDGLET